MNLLLEHIQKFAALTDEAINAFSAVIKVIKLKKGEILLKASDTCNYLFFVEKGSLRSYYNKGTKDITISFTLANDFTTSFYSFVSRNPSYETIEALEDSNVMMIHYNDLQQMFSVYPSIEKIYRTVLEHYYIKMEEKIIFDKFKTAKERYNNLMENRPEIIQKAGVGDIASYLSISIETLSRIRSNN
jgi:CRP-like cAMP-binding protein